MKGIHRLTKARVDSWLAQPKEGEPQRKLPDGGGLNLVRLPGGGATWQARYRLGGVERTYSIGPAHVVSLASARDEHARVKLALREHKDPVQLRVIARAAELTATAGTFGEVATAWLRKRRGEWGEYHYDKSSKALERHVSSLDRMPVRDIPAALVAHVIGVVQKKAGRETAAKILRHVRGIFRYAQATGLRPDNPAEAVVEILGKAGKVKHRAALTTADGVRGVLATLAAAPISPAVLMCHRLIAFTAVRIANAVSAHWEEFDLETGVWRIPREKMKMQDREHDHKVILPGPLVEYLRAWRAAQKNPAAGWLFPGQQGRAHITREAVEKALLEHGFRDKHTCHGWRASFSTLAKESGLFDHEVVNLALDHVHDTDVARAYDRGERLEKRVKLMRWWGELLAG